MNVSEKAEFEKFVQEAQWKGMDRCIEIVEAHW